MISAGTADTAARQRDADRLRKLLHLAENAGTEGEAMAAATAAAKLMASRGLTEEDAETIRRSPDRDTINAENIISFGARRPQWMELLAVNICRLSGCFAWIVRTREFQPSKLKWRSEFCLHAAGRAEDLAISKALIPAFAQVVREVSLRSTRARQGRASYQLGLAIGLSERMGSVQNLVLERIRRSSRSALEPVDRVAQARAAAGPEKLLSASPLRVAHTTAFVHGIQDADDIKLPGQQHALQGQLALKEAT